MRLGTFIKTPAERKRYAVDYSNWLETGETVSSYTITPTSGLTISSSTLTTGNTVLVFFVAGGTAGQQYTLDILANTSGGQIKEDTVLFNIRSA